MKTMLMIVTIVNGLSDWLENYDATQCPLKYYREFLKILSGNDISHNPFSYPRLDWKYSLVSSCRICLVLG
jgi:hypothetical protein